MNTPFLRLLILTSALHFSILIYIFVPFFLAAQDGYQHWHQGFFTTPENTLLIYVLAALSMVLTLLVLTAPKFLKPGKPNAKQAANQPIGIAPSGILLDFTNLDQNTFTMTILRMAFAEAIAIFGLVLAMINQAPLWVLPFAIWGLMLQILVGPIVGKVVGKKILDFSTPHD